MLPRHLAVGVTCSSDARVGVIEDGLTLRSGPIKPFDPGEACRNRRIPRCCFAAVIRL